MRFMQENSSRRSLIFMLTKKIPLLPSLAGGFFVLLFDQTIKYFMRINPNFSFYLLKPWLGLEFFQNPGIAFGIPLQNSLIIFFTPLIILYLVVWLQKQRSKPDVSLKITGSILIMSGAVSNYADRILFNYTIDYLRILNSVINLADMSIISGVILLLWKNDMTPHLDQTKKM